MRTANLCDWASGSAVFIVYLLHAITVFFAEKFKSDLMKIAMTTLSSKILSQDKEHFAQLAVDAVLRLKVILGLV